MEIAMHMLLCVLQHCRGCGLNGAEQGNLRETVSAEPQEQLVRSHQCPGVG